MESPAPAGPSPSEPFDAGARAHLETEKAERSRWLGTMLMYAPLLPLMVMVCGLVEAFAAGWGPGPAGTQPPWYVMLPFTVGACGLLPAIPVAVFGAGKRMLAAARLTRLCEQHRVETLGPWPAVAPGERIGPLLTDEVVRGRVVLVYMPAPRPIWRVLGYCAAGILSGVMILVAVMVAQSQLGGRDLLNLLVPAVMLIGVLSVFGSRRLSFESSAEGPVFVSRYRFPGIPCWFTKQRPLDDPQTRKDAPRGRANQRKQVGSFIAQAGVRWGLDSGAFSEWKLSRLEETVAQCLSAEAAD